MKRLFFAGSLLTLTLAGVLVFQLLIAPRATEENYWMIDQGMRLADVESLLGRPIGNRVQDNGVTMQAQATTWRALAALATLASCGLTIFAGEGLGKKDAAKPLPPEIVKAWKGAGASVGWMKLDTMGLMNEDENGAPGTVPAFRFRLELKQGVVANLTPPETAFGLFFSGTLVTDALLKDLSGLKNLRALNLNSTPATDAMLKDLAGLEGLEALYLNYTKVTDAGLKELTGLKSLRTLTLHHTLVADAGVKELAKLKTLQSLDLIGTKVTDGGLKQMAGFDSLRSLDLSHTKTTDIGLKHVAELTSLQRLRLYNTQATDVGMKELARLKSLQVLDLERTPVTDAGLKELAGLKSLQRLELFGTPVTAEGVAALQKELPACKITYR